MTDSMTTYEDVIRKLRAMEECGLDIAELKTQLIDAFHDQEMNYRRAGMGTDNKDRAEKVIEILLRRFRVPAPRAVEDRGAPPPGRAVG